MIMDVKSSISELTEMGSTEEQTFTFTKVNGEEGGTFFNNNGIIEMKYVGEENALHESVHGYQYWKRTFSPGITDRINREIPAYQRQYSFNPRSVTNLTSSWGKIKSRSDIIIPWVLFLYNSDGSYPYSPDRKSPDLKSIRKLYEKK